MNKNIKCEQYEGKWMCTWTSPVKNECGLSNQTYGYGETKEKALEHLEKNMNREEW